MPKYSNASSRINLDVGFNVDKSSLEGVKRSLQELQKLNIGSFSGPQKDLKAIQALAKKVETALNNAFNVKLNSVNLEKFNSELIRQLTTIAQIQAAFAKAGTAGQTAFSKLATSVLTTNLQLKETHSLIQNFGTTMLNTVKWGFASSIINNFTGSIQQAVSYVEGLDKSLTNIRIVTGDSREEMVKFAEEANRASQALGRSTMDYTKAALSYYQQGLSDELVAARTEATLKAQNITGAGDEMADYLTAVWNGYRVANEEAELYVDKMAAVADSSASNMALLATAMSKVASTADMMGVPMDSLNAQIATIVATTRQAPESVGNALKTIYTRVADIKTGSLDALISLGNYSSKMKEVGIDVLDSSGRFRDLGDIIELIGSKWDGMSKEQQIYLARTMAGQRQINNLLALFNNWDKYSDLVTTSMESQGTTMEKNSRYMESLAAHLNQLNAAQLRFKSSMIDSDSFKGLVDFGTGAVTVFANLIESIGGGGNAILALGGIATNVFSGIISRLINNLITHFQSLDYNAKQLANDIQMTKLFGQLEGFAPGAVLTMVQAKLAIQQYYGVLSNLQINAYQGMVRLVGQLETLAILYLNLAKDARAFADTVDRFDGFIDAEKNIMTLELLDSVLTNLKEKIENFKTGSSGFANLQQEAQQLKMTLTMEGQNNLIWERAEKSIPTAIQSIEKLSQQTKLTTILLQLLKNAIREVINFSQLSIGNVGVIKDLLYQAEQTSNKVNLLKENLKAFQKEAAQLSNVEMFTKAVSGAMSLVSAINSVKNAFKALNNDSLSDSEQIMQFIMGLGSAVGMLGMAYNSLGPIAVKAFNAMSGGMFSVYANAGKLNMVLKTIGSSLIRLALNPVFIILTAAIVGTIVVAKKLHEVWTADARAAQQAALNAAAASLAYDKVKQSADLLKSSLEEYNSFQDTLASLTRGTEEWNLTIQQSNELVLDLINKFPELAEQVLNVNGQLVLKDGAEDLVQSSMNQQLEQANLNKAFLAEASRSASIRSQATDLTRQYARDYSTPSETLYAPQIEKIAKILNDFEDGLIDNINPDGLNNYIERQTGVSEELVAAIRNDSTGIKELQSAIRLNTNVTKLQYQALVANSEELQKDSTYQAANDEQKQLILSLTTSSLQTAIKDAENTWLGTLSDLSKFNDARNQQWSQTILDAVSAAEGLTVRWDTNSIRGRGLDMLFVLQGEDGKLITYRKEQIASLLASKEALDGLSESVTNASEVINKIESSDLTEDQKSALEGYIANHNFDDVSKETLLSLKEIDLSDYFDEELEDIAGAVGVTTDKLLQDFDDLVNSSSESFGKAFEQLPDFLSEQIQAVLNDLNLTISGLQRVSENLLKALAQGSALNYSDLFKLYAKMDNVEGFEKVASTLDFSTATADSFAQALLEAGLTTNLTNSLLQAYIDIQRLLAGVTSEGRLQQYKDIHDIISGLSKGDSIDSEQAAALLAAGINIDNFFKHMADGSYELTANADDFYNYANSISLQPFVDELNKVSETVNKGIEFSESGYAYNAERTSEQNNVIFDRFSSTASNDAQLQSQLDFLQSINLTEELHNKIVQESLLILQQRGSLNQEEAEKLALVVQNYRNQWLGFDEQLNMTKEQQAELALQVENSALRHPDEDINLLSYLKLKDYIKEAGDLLEGFSLNVKDNLLVASLLAEAQLRYNKAILRSFDNIEDWKLALQGGPLAAAEVADDLKNTYSDLLDLPFESISDSFAVDPENLQLLEQAINGDILAYDELAARAQQDIAVQAGFDNTLFNNGVNNLLNLYYQVNGLDDIEVGADLNDDAFLAELSNMVTQAGMTALQAEDYLASMGIDAEVTEVPAESTDTVETQSSLQPTVTWTEHTIPIISDVINGLTGRSGTIRIPHVSWESNVSSDELTKSFTGHALKVKSAHKTSGGGVKYKNTPKKSFGKKSGNGGGKKSGGSSGKSSTPKAATQAKLNTSKIETKAKTALTNPYLQQLKAFLRQEKILDNLQNKLKKLVNKDRLKNLKDQNKTLEEQVKILNKELDISKNQAAENSTANYAKRLKLAFGSVLRFDSDGQISDINALEKASVNTYNAAAKAAADAFESLKAKYNDYIANTWNKYSTQEQQEANKAEKERWDLRIKNAEEAAKKAVSAALEEYKTREDLIKSYNSAWEADQDRLEKIRDLQDLIIENQIAISKIKVDLSIDTGLAERDWLEFEKKFIKKIDNDDFLGQAKASVKELMSYFNSKQVQETANLIKKLQNLIAVMLRGGTSTIYGNNLAQAKEDLEDYMKQQMDDLLDIQDLVDDIKDNYLDAIDSAKDKMDLQIDQYERVNDLVEHNVKLTELLYGDKAYTTMNKYYNMLQKNNKKELDSLRKQQQYWQKRMNQLVVGSDTWKQFKKNLDDTTDSLNNKLEEMIDNLAKKWLNKVDGIIEKLNNGLTNGRGLDYLDEQWDYINNFDDNFLDTVNSAMGKRLVERAYQLAIDNLGDNPKEQQRINKLMNLQLKILKLKNKLTEYDVLRAKALLQVEQARMALEDARNAKTKMRLRRDSQGNYTYQYVADEEKLDELQAALDDAQTNLYNQDKEHYKQNLNELYDTYKDYINKMRLLTQEYNSTLDKKERARIQARINLLKLSTNLLMQGLTLDNKYALKYLNESFFDALQIDPSQYTAELQMLIMNQNIPQMKSNIQDLANEIVGQGGILNATANAMTLISKATKQYDTDVKNILKTAGTSLQTVSQAVDSSGNALDKNIKNAEKFITANDKLIKACDAQIKEIQLLMDWLDKYLNKIMNVETLIANLRNAYGTNQKLNGSNLTADNISVENINLDTTAGMEYTGNPATDAAKVKSQIDLLLAQYEKFLKNMTIATFDTGGATGTWADALGRLAFLHQKELVLNATDTENILRAVDMIRNMTNSLSGFANNELNDMMTQAVGMLGGINTNSTLDQNVHIDASFPNVREHTEIEQAFENLVNMASMHASGYRD